jgi:hypothetical protein
LFQVKLAKQVETTIQENIQFSRAELKPGNSTTFISTKAKSSVIKFYEMLVQQKYYKELLLLISGNIQDFT